MSKASLIEYIHQLESLLFNKQTETDKEDIFQCNDESIFYQLAKKIIKDYIPGKSLITSNLIITIYFNLISKFMLRKLLVQID